VERTSNNVDVIGADRLSCCFIDQGNSSCLDLTVNGSEGPAKHRDSNSHYEVITSSVNVGFPILLGELGR
jgi:hypothetical protein